jgi:hypothetical protein
LRLFSRAFVLREIPRPAVKTRVFGMTPSGGAMTPSGRFPDYITPAH